MSLSLSTIFIFSVLLLGIVSYPSINFGNTVDSNLKISSYLISAFAEDDEDENEDEDKTKTSNINNGTKSDTTDSEDENEDEDKTKTSNINNGIKSDTTDSEDENEDEDKTSNINNGTKSDTTDSEDETEIEVEIKNDQTKVKINLNGNKYRFVVNDISESAIISAIIDKTGLTEDQIRANWDFETEDNSNSSDKNDVRTNEKIMKHENDAKKIANDTVLQLQQKIDQLEQRLQDLLNKFETGKYYGTVTNADSTPNSYAASFTGTATSLDDNSLVSSVDGNIYLESLTTGTDSFKLRVTGGDILIGNTFYDFVFGKARLVSSDDGTSMIILGQVMDDQGDVHTLRLTLNTTSALTGDFGSEPVQFEIDPSNSKIAKQWTLDASGNFSLLS